LASSVPPTSLARLQRRNRTPYEVIETSRSDGFLAEADSFKKLVSEAKSCWSGATPGESLDIAATLDAIAQSARADGQWIDVGTSRPS
jgi:xylose dehydrogenase (NAD/NADP)